MNDDVNEALAELCRDKATNDYVFSSPKTKSCLRETKRGFRTACKLAGIEGLIWKDLRATFGTRLGRITRGQRFILLVGLPRRDE